MHTAPTWLCSQGKAHKVKSRLHQSMKTLHRQKAFLLQRATVRKVLQQSMLQDLGPDVLRERVCTTEETSRPGCEIQQAC